MKSRFRIFKEGDYWVIQKHRGFLNGWTRDFVLYGNWGKFQRFSTVEEAKKAIDEHRKIEEAWDREYKESQKLRRRTMIEY